MSNSTVKIEYVGTTDYGTEAQEITSGTPPFDVVIFAQVSLARQLAEGGYLTDLTPYLQQSGMLNQLIPYYLEPVNVSGHIYGVPVDAWTKTGIYVYVLTIQKYGIPIIGRIHEGIGPDGELSPSFEGLRQIHRGRLPARSTSL